jgi:DNA-binding transcriptional MerR regulator
MQGNSEGSGDAQMALMADVPTPIEIPRRSLFRAAEVCELIQVKPYVLRSWESEFPDLGVSKAGGPRVYRRSDVELVARIKHLVVVDGLTLAGARRRLEEEAAPVGVDAPVIDELIGENARERLTEVKRGLRSILDLLERGSDMPELLLVPERVSRGTVTASTKREAAGSKARARASGSARRSKR